MENIEIFLPDINFKVIVPKQYSDEIKSVIFQSVILYKNDNNKYIEIEYIVDKNRFEQLQRKIKDSKGIIYDSFKKQTHKEIKINNEYYYLVNTEEYIGNKIDEMHYKIIVEKNTKNSMNWIVRIIRELYLREKEDKEYSFMHGTGIEIDNKGILLLGTSGSGKTTLAVKFLEINRTKKFLSNDRVLVNRDMIMDYFPHAVTYAMGTVKNNSKLDKYFRENRFLEQKKKINYEDAENDVDCNTPLTDVENIFELTKMTARSKLDAIIFPRFEKDFDGIQVLDMTEDEKRNLLQETNFTPYDTESLRKPWIRKRNINEKELLDIRKKLIDKLIRNISIKKIKYGVKTNVEDILKVL